MDAQFPEIAITSYCSSDSSNTWASVSINVMSWPSADSSRVSVAPTFPLPAMMIFIATPEFKLFHIFSIVSLNDAENNHFFKKSRKPRKARRVKRGGLFHLERREVEKRVCTNERQAAHGFRRPS